MTHPTPRPIQSTDPIDSFDCGITPLNEWLSGQALRNEKNGYSRTYVFISPDTSLIAGFYSLSSWSVNRRMSGGWLSRNAPDPIPVVLLGQLAVDLCAQNTGLGRILLTHAIHNATKAADLIGARALVAEAVNEQAAQFYLHAGLRPSSSRDDLFFFPLRPSIKS
ncbi:MAG: GNAT family N-acetyltransferase [Actinomycetaceae bacterium]|nr:GNAT family N-acetyltransferase [Actinomycetaceae bacterium]